MEGLSPLSRSTPNKGLWVNGDVDAAHVGYCVHECGWRITEDVTLSARVGEEE